MPRQDLIELRAGTAAAWATANPVLAEGEPGAAVDGTSVVFKVGNGLTAWNALPIANAVTLSEFLGTAANQAAMLALVGNRGDWAIRSDTGTTWVVIAEPSSLIGNWKKIETPTDVVTSVNGRAGAVTGLAEQSALTTEATTRGDADTALDTAKAPKASPTGTGVATWPAFAATGLTGAVTPVRLVGGTTSGAPTTGTFVAGDYVVALDGIMWLCTVGGTPGTWVDLSSSGRELDYVEASTAQGPLTAETTLTLSRDLSFNVGDRPVYVEAEITDLYSSTAALAVGIYICDAANAHKVTAYQSLSATGIAEPVRIHERIAPGAGATVRRLRVARVSGTGSWNTNLDTGCRVSLGAYAR